MNKIKEKLHKIEMIAGISAVLVFSLFLFMNSGITGFLSLDLAIQEVDITLEKSQSIMMTSSRSEPFYLTSFKLGGEVIGDGVVEVYISNGEKQKLLVYRNVRPKKKGMDVITGMVVKGEEMVSGKDIEEGSWLMIAPAGDVNNELPRSLEEGQEAVSGVFTNECGDTCFMKMELSNELSYQLLVRIEPGTILKFDNILYSIETDVEG